MFNFPSFWSRKNHWSKVWSLYVRWLIKCVSNNKMSSFVIKPKDLNIKCQTDIELCNYVGLQRAKQSLLLLSNLYFVWRGSQYQDAGTLVTPCPEQTGSPPLWGPVTWYRVTIASLDNLVAALLALDNSGCCKCCKSVLYQQWSDLSALNSRSLTMNDVTIKYLHHK